MSEPSVMLMDEPFGALDPITRLRMHDELLALNRKLEKTIVIVTRDLAEAFQLGDLVVLMHKGAIVQKGDRDAFLNDPANDFVREYGWLTTRYWDAHGEDGTAHFGRRQAFWQRF